MSDIPMAYHWKGQRIEELTHSELLEAFKGLAKERESIRNVFETDQRMRATLRAFNDPRYDGYGGL